MNVHVKLRSNDDHKSAVFTSARCAAMVALLTGVALNDGPAAAKSFTLAVGSGFKPFIDKNLPEGGMMTDIVRSAYEAAGHDVNIKFMPWKRARLMTQKGQVSGSYAWVKNEKREKKFHFSDPIYVSALVPVTSSGNASAYTSYSDFKGTKMCKVLGWSVANDKIEKMIENGEIEQAAKVDNFGTCLKLVAAGRADWVIAERPLTIQTAKSKFGSADKIGLSDFTVSELKYYAIFSKNSGQGKANTKAFNRALAELKKSGRYQEIVEKHLQ